MDEATLCHPIVDGEMLLIRKQRGLGEGNLVGPGGKIESGETPREAARREVTEELRIDPVGVEKCGEFAFHFRDDTPDDDSMFVHVFRADGVAGEPEPTPEAVPEWHPTDDLPYDEMWVDDRIWIPHMLAGDSFSGTFVLTDDGDALHSYEMELGVTFESQSGGDGMELLDELRILAQNGLEYTDDPYDRERYDRILELTGEWYGESLDPPPEDVRAQFAAELGHVTPKVGGQAAVFDANGKLLLQRRADDGAWCIPGGYTDPNESPEETAVRETREETGLVVEPLELVEVYTRKPGAHGPHCLVNLLYRCRRVGGELTVSREGTDLQYWDVDAVPEWHKNHERLARDAVATLQSP